MTWATFSSFSLPRLCGAFGERALPHERFIPQNAVQDMAFYATICASFGEVGDCFPNARSLTDSVMAHCMADALTGRARCPQRAVSWSGASLRVGNLTEDK